MSKRQHQSLREEGKEAVKGCLSVTAGVAIMVAGAVALLGWAVSNGVFDNPDRRSPAPTRDVPQEEWVEIDGIRGRNAPTVAFDDARGTTKVTQNVPMMSINAGRFWITATAEFEGEAWSREPSIRFTVTEDGTPATSIAYAIGPAEESIALEDGACRPYQLDKPIAARWFEIRVGEERFRNDFFGPEWLAEFQRAVYALESD